MKEIHFENKWWLWSFETTLSNKNVLFRPVICILQVTMALIHHYTEISRSLWLHH